MNSGKDIFLELGAKLDCRLHIIMQDIVIRHERPASATKMDYSKHIPLADIMKQSNNSLEEWEKVLGVTSAL